jgi:hypothetical protein
MKRLLIAFFFLGCALVAAAQNPPAPRGGRGQWMGQGVAGTIVSTSADGFTLKTLQGKTVSVKVSAGTRFRADGQPAKLADFKAGDMVMVRGQQSGDDTWKAEAVMSRPAAADRMREGLGKEFIAGEVKAIDGLKLTIARIDGQTQTIEVNENTSFRKNREDITFPDIKVGDHVFGRGKMNDAGVFVPTALNVGEPGMMMGGGTRRGEERRPPQQQPPQ